MATELQRIKTSANDALPAPEMSPKITSINTSIQTLSDLDLKKHTNFHFRTCVIYHAPLRNKLYLYYAPQLAYLFMMTVQFILAWKVQDRFYIAVSFAIFWIFYSFVIAIKGPTRGMAHYKMSLIDSRNHVHVLEVLNGEKAARYYRPEKAQGLFISDETIQKMAKTELTTEEIEDLKFQTRQVSTNTANLIRGHNQENNELPSNAGLELYGLQIPESENYDSGSPESPENTYEDDRPQHVVSVTSPSTDTLASDEKVTDSSPRNLDTPKKRYPGLQEQVNTSSNSRIDDNDSQEITVDEPLFDKKTVSMFGEKADALNPNTPQSLKPGHGFVKRFTSLSTLSTSLSPSSPPKDPLLMQPSVGKASGRSFYPILICDALSEKYDGFVHGISIYCKSERYTECGYNAMRSNCQTYVAEIASLFWAELHSDQLVHIEKDKYYRIAHRRSLAKICYLPFESTIYLFSFFRLISYGILIMIYVFLVIWLRDDPPDDHRPLFCLKSITSCTAPQYVVLCSIFWMFNTAISRCCAAGKKYSLVGELSAQENKIATFIGLGRDVKEVSRDSSAEKIHGRTIHTVQWFTEKEKDGKKKLYANYMLCKRKVSCVVYGMGLFFVFNSWFVLAVSPLAGPFLALLFRDFQGWETAMLVICFLFGGSLFLAVFVITCFSKDRIDPELKRMMDEKGGASHDVQEIRSQQVVALSGKPIAAKEGGDVLPDMNPDSPSKQWSASLQTGDSRVPKPMPTVSSGSVEEKAKLQYNVNKEKLVV